MFFFDITFQCKLHWVLSHRWSWSRRKIPSLYSLFRKEVYQTIRVTYWLWPLLSITGTLVGNSYNFANSWAMHSEKMCQRSSPMSHTCNISSETADQVCAVTRESGLHLLATGKIIITSSPQLIVFSFFFHNTMWKVLTSHTGTIFSWFKQAQS